MTHTETTVYERNHDPNHNSELVSIRRGGRRVIGWIYSDLYLGGAVGPQLVHRTVDLDRRVHSGRHPELLVALDDALPMTIPDPCELETA